jgi:hypothetical protein
MKLNKDWEQEQDSWNKLPIASISNNKGIMKTVKITQL